MSARVDTRLRSGRHERPRGGTARAPLRLRAGVRLRRGHLDWALADGADPTATRLLWLRAAQLLEPRTRLGVADRLEQALEEAAGPPRHAISSSVPLQRDAILTARDALLQLVAALRTTESPAPRGVALVIRLLTDGTSPLYAPHPVGALWHAARRATDALEDGGPRR